MKVVRILVVVLHGMGGFVWVVGVDLAKRGGSVWGREGVTSDMCKEVEAKQ